MQPIDPDQKTDARKPSDGALSVITNALSIVATAAGAQLGSPIAAAILSLGGQFIMHRTVGPLLGGNVVRVVNDIGDRLLLLEQSGRLKVDDVVASTHFQEAIAEAIKRAPFASAETKRNTLRNAVLNSAFSEQPDDLERHYFWSAIDRLSAVHLSMLSMLQAPGAWVLPDGTSAGPQPYIGDLLRLAFPQLPGGGFFQERLLSDLKSEGFLSGDVGHLIANGGGPGDRPCYTSDLGDRFLAFVSDPE